MVGALRRIQQRAMAKKFPKCDLFARASSDLTESPVLRGIVKLLRIYLSGWMILFPGNRAAQGHIPINRFPVVQLSPNLP